MGNVTQGSNQVLVLPEPLFVPKSKPRPVPKFDEPDLADAVVVRAMLQKGLHLIPEIVDMVMDHAEYWARSSTKIDYVKQKGRELQMAGRSPVENMFLFRCPPVGVARQPIGMSWKHAECQPLPLEAENDREYFFDKIAGTKPELLNPVRKIVFVIKSHDQGWASTRLEGGFRGSFTWFEAGLERFEAKKTCVYPCAYDSKFGGMYFETPLPVCALRPVQPKIKAIEPPPDPEPAQQTDTPSVAEPGSHSPASSFATPPPRYEFDHPLGANQRFLVQRNRAAMRDHTVHRIVWSYLDNDEDCTDEPAESAKAMHYDLLGQGRGTGTGRFVRDLKLGDVVTLWAKARFPGWTNVIASAEVNIYWAV